VNGEYYQDYSPEKPIVHYSQWRAIDLDGLLARYEALSAVPAANLLASSPLTRRPGFALPRFFTTSTIEVSDLNSNAGSAAIEAPSAAQVNKLLDELNSEGYWPTPLVAVSNVYSGDGDTVPAAGDYSQTRVGDASDTSPYVTNDPVLGISLGSYIQNMSALMQAL
jgi:hypothetical protein